MLQWQGIYKNICRAHGIIKNLCVVLYHYLYKLIIFKCIACVINIALHINKYWNKVLMGFLYFLH